LTIRQLFGRMFLFLDFTTLGGVEKMRKKGNKVLAVRLSEAEREKLDNLVSETSLSISQILSTAVVNTADEIFQLMKRKGKALN